MTILGPILTCNGYNSVTGQCASTSIPSNIPTSQYDGYMGNTIDTHSGYGASALVDIPPGALEPDYLGPWSIPSLSQVLGGFTQGIIHPLDTFTGTNTDAMNKSAGDTGKAVASVGALLGIVTDVPRMATIVVGGLLLAAGIFAIAGSKPPVYINPIAKALKE